MAIILRADTGSALSHNQLDTNFTSFFYSSSLSGTTLTLFKTGSTALGISVASSSVTLPGGTLWTASAADISRNGNVTVTGSFKQGSAGIVATGENAHAEGNATQAIGWHSHAEGRQTQARGSGSHAEGYLTVATGSYSHAEGVASQAKGTYSHAEGNANIATGASSHAEGLTTEAIGEGSHAEGVATITPGYGAHAEGFNSIASGSYSHAEGGNTIASGSYSHAEGDSTISLGEYSHTEGQATQALGNYSHAEGQGTVALGDFQHVQGQYNMSSSAPSAFIVGNGTTTNNRRNLVFASGSQFQVSGSLNVSGAINTVGDLTVQGNITAQQYIVSTSVYFVTESFFSGSHVFGNSLDDTHQFTGSILASGSTHRITGSVNVNGTITAASTITTSGFLYANTIQPTTALILTGGGTDGLKMSGSTLNIFATNTLTVGSGSYTQPNATEYIRINSGGLQINNGYDLTVHGNKQFNHGMFYHTASISVANGTSGSALLSTTAVANGVSIVDGSKITVANPGYYNIQFSAQLAQGVGAANFYIWFKKNGVNMANSTSVKTLSGTSNSIMTVDIIDYAINSGDYYEIAHQSNASNSTLEYIAASGNYPAAPSLIVTVQQVR